MSRERTVALGLRKDFERIWTRAWEEFQFALPGCETSTDAQQLFVEAASEIFRREPGPIAVVGIDFTPVLPATAWRLAALRHVSEKTRLS